MKDILWEYFWHTGRIGLYLLYRRLENGGVNGEPEEKIS
ncbi:MAG TPA: YqzL family protein [Firmicutes bacterium]|nr:YqzL family protein [Bacillota bacterium]